MTHQKTRLEFIVEAPIQKMVLDMLDEQGAQGYTVLPALAGRGHEGRWSREGQIIDAGRMIVVVCIADDEVADAILRASQDIIEKRIGIVSRSTVDVIRDDHF